MPSRAIEDLYPEMQPKVLALIAACQAQGIDLLITSTVRTLAEQAALYAQGRTTPGDIVTKARPGESFHNVRRAIDVVPLVGGKAIWTSMFWEEIGRLGENQGFVWGGTFRTRKDKPHFEWQWCAVHATRHAKAISFSLDGMCNGRSKKGQVASAT